VAVIGERGKKKEERRKRKEKSQSYFFRLTPDGEFPLRSAGNGLRDTLCKACPTRGPDQSESGVFACVSKDKRIISVANYLGLKKASALGRKR